MKRKNLLFAVVLVLISNYLPIIRVSAQTDLWSVTQSGGSLSLGDIFKVNSTNSSYTSSYGFNVTNPGSMPYSTPCQASNGKLYGMTSSGGAYGNGVIYSFDPSSGTYADLLDFNVTNGANPYGSLTQASNGKLYGMTYDGGAHGAGVIFSFDPSSNIYTDLLDFNGSDGAYPYGSLMQAANGKLYGMASIGGGIGYGLLFSFDTTSSNPNPLTDLFDFDYALGGYPNGSLIQASGGKLYGMTYSGGANSIGVLFSFDTTSANPTPYTDLYDFDGTSGAYPEGSLIQASNGKLFGLTYEGGSNGLGALFSFDTASTNPSPYSDLYNFNGISGGNYPYGNLMQASNGKLYGMTLNGGANGYGAIFSFNLSGNIYSDLFNFNGTTGGNPYGSLMQATNGKLYGTAYYGGINSAGVLFSFDYSGNTYTDLVDYNLNNGSDPEGSLMQASNGKLYGMTYSGGSNNDGVLFSVVASTDTYTKLVDFNGTNGANPTGSLMQALSGVVYGMTKKGGSSNDGVLFSFNSTTNTYTKLLDFSGTNGAYPQGGLTQASNGKLYGMTFGGGAHGYGVLFSFDPSSNTYAKLLDFNNTNGSNPYGSLMPASNGKLYGMTYSGGSHSYGVLFSFDPSSNNYSDLHDFNSTDGTNPYGNLIQATNGKLYAMTSSGGANSEGVLFSFDTTSTNPTPYIDLLDFNGSNGANPGGSLMQALSGKLYGMTTGGGSYSEGVLFSFDPTSLAYTKIRDLNSPDGTSPLYSGFIQLTPITTGSISSTLCPGTVVRVSYTAVSSAFLGGNIFTAQLSDSSGSFASPVNIGALGSLSSGSINATVPSNTHPGTGYRIRVVGSNHAVTGSDNGSDITIYPLPKGSATPSTEAICSATLDSITLSGTISGTTFSWVWSGSGTGTVTGREVSCTSGCGALIKDSLFNSGAGNGTVTYQITPHANGCAGTVFVGSVTVRPVPIATTNAYTNPVCAGTYTNISIKSVTGGTVFSWTTPSITNPVGGGTILNAVSGSGAAISQKLANTGTTYGVVTYSITPSYAGCHGPAITRSDTVKPGPNAHATPLPESICSGSRTGITLDTGTIAGTTFKWSVSVTDSIQGSAAGCLGGCPRFINDSLYNTGTAGSKTVTYSITPSANGCTGAIINDIVTVRPVPTAVTTASDTSICSGRKTNIKIKGIVTGTIYKDTATLTTLPDGGTITGFIDYTGATIGQTLVNTGTTPGVVTYSITPQYLGCSGIPIQSAVTINPVANGTVSPAIVTINAGSRTADTLYPGSVAGTIFTWNYNAPYTITGPPSACFAANDSCGRYITDSLFNTATINQVMTYNITPWANGCAGTKFTLKVTVKPKPIVRYQSNFILCSGSHTDMYFTTSTYGTVLNYTAAVVGAADDTLSGFSSGSGFSIIQKLVNSGTTKRKVVYTITPDYLGSIGNSIYDTVTVNPVPKGSASPSPAGICGGSHAGVTLIPGAVASTHFTWSASFQGAISGATSCGDTSGACGTSISDILVNSSSAGPIEAYIITPYANGCAGTKFTENVTVQAGVPATPVISGQTVGICAYPQTYSYVVTNLAPFNTVAWSLPSGCTVAPGYTLNSNPVVISFPSWYAVPFVPSSNDTSLLKATAENLCHTHSIPGSVKPTPILTVSITGNKKGLCAATGQVYSVPNYTDHSYSWSVTPGVGITIEGGGSSTNSMSADFADNFTSGNITCTISGCGNPEVFNLNVTGASAAPTALSGLTIHCANSGPYTYTAVAPFGATSYIWTLPPGGSATSLTTTVPSINVSYTASATGPITVAARNDCGVSNAISMTVFLNSNCRSSGMPDEEATNNLVVYPNPAHDKLNIEFNSPATGGNYVIKLIDVTGRMVMSRVNTSLQGSNILELDLGNLARGLYILSFSSDDQTKQIKIDVQ